MPPRPRAPQKRQNTKCAYQEGRRRCPYDAAMPITNPPLCRAHQLSVAETAKPKAPSEMLAGMLVDLLNGEAIDRDAAVNAARQVFADWKTAQARARTVPGGWAPRPGPGSWRTPQHPPPQQEDPELRARAMARKVMGFAPTEQLTADKIRQRKRTLAQRYHPDLPGGSTEKMAMINDAADILMRML